MGDLSLTVNNAGRINPTRNFEANSAPLETTTLGINFDKGNDFSKELQIGKDGPKIYVTPDQAFALKVSLRNAEVDEAMSGGKNVSVVINGQTFTASAGFLKAQLD